MATACYPPLNDSAPTSISPNVHLNVYPRTLPLNDSDNRYPTLPSPPLTNRRSSNILTDSSSRNQWEPQPMPLESSHMSRLEQPMSTSPRAVAVLEDSIRARLDAFEATPEATRPSAISQHSQQQPRHESILSHALPPGAAQPLHRLEDTMQRTPSTASADTKPTAESLKFTSNVRTTPSSQPRLDTPRDAVSHEPSFSTMPSLPRHPPLPVAGIGAGINNLSASALVPHSSQSPPYSPSLGIPVSPKPRAYAQQPTYITPPATPNALNPVYNPAPISPPEEVCVECAMRDQDMADVDVTSPGVWERASDVFFEELHLREQEDQATGATPDPSRPRTKGGRLTEQNLKIWLSINPREPTSRQHTLEQYIRSQRKLLEAEALAHARAMQEARQLDSRMRDAYSQLRRSAYDMGSSAAPADDTGGVRIKPPRSPSTPSAVPHTRSHSRDVTLLENGMIVEHVDVRKEEREERERRRKEERRERSRTRKSSRSSKIDASSMISASSVPLYTDSGVGGLKPHSRNSQGSSARPASVLSSPMERPSVPRQYTQSTISAVSDMYSPGSPSPRRSRLFSGGWRSQVSLAPSGISGMSGSMMNMHVALQQEMRRPESVQTIDAHTRRSQVLASTHHEPSLPLTEPKKKKSGFSKLWNILKGPSKSEDLSKSRVQHQGYEDDLPLAPPPPLSYLVERRPGEASVASGRHASTPSLGLSPGSAPSTSLPSPISPRMPGAEREVVNGSRPYLDSQEYCPSPEEGVDPATFRNVQPMMSEPDMRRRVSKSPPIPATPLPFLVSNTLPNSRPPSQLIREKSLPPLPGQKKHRPSTGHADSRPRTVYSYDPRHMTLPPGFGNSRTPESKRRPSTAQDIGQAQGAFANDARRRQSFGGTVRPNLAVQTMPASSPNFGQEKYATMAPRYDEFGLSRRSLGPLDNVQEYTERPASSPNKRKSRFSFASLLGKKSFSHDRTQPLQDGITQEFPPFRTSASSGPDDAIVNGKATSASKHSITSTGGLRMSLSSRKVEELVAQDPEFVAYRYPSTDQRLDLLR